MKAEYTIWADGSFRDTKSPGGAGWVVEDAHGRIIAEESLALAKGTVLSSTEAEIIAATHALRSVRTNGFIRFYGDHMGVLSVLRHGTMPPNAIGDPRMFDLYSDLICARGGICGSFSYASSRNKRDVEKSKNMERAHNLAQRGWQAGLSL